MGEVTLPFYLTAPELEGEYAVKIEVYNGTLVEEKEVKFMVKESPLILRARTVGLCDKGRSEEG